MLLETAHVVAVEPKSVWVETIKRSTCGSCSAKKGCGHALLEQVVPGRSNYLQVFSGSVAAGDCSVNDQVQISIPEQVIVRGSLMVYIVPLVAMLGGATLASTLSSGGTDVLAIAGAVSGFLLGVALVRWHAWLHRFDESLQPKLMSIVRSPVEIIAVR